MMCSEQKRNLLKWWTIMVLLSGMPVMQKCPLACGITTGHESNRMQFVSYKEAGGKGKGESVLFDRFSNISTSGGTLSETATIPRHNIVFSQGTLTINRASQRKAA